MIPKVDKKLSARIIGLREKIVAHFDAGDWEEIGLITGHSRTIDRHDRLLRSLNWNDQDYSGNVLSVVKQIAESDPKALDDFDELLQKKYPEESHFISAKPSPNKITFAPHVFEVQDLTVEQDLVSVMMPFDAKFSKVYEAIKAAVAGASLRCKRADDIWEESVIMQDIFNLILKSRIVIVDFTARNPNVMYETGIAHTLGKLVIPITQSMQDIPFDMAHHRALKYLPNQEGYAELEKNLMAKLTQLS